METKPDSEHNQKPDTSPTRLEGMETLVGRGDLRFRSRLRPALRGWKHWDDEQIYPSLSGSPTRLEGMETR